MNIQEKLVIKNFFSIKDFEWDIKGFNVLTGRMASGKSLTFKLLYFCEQVFHQTIFFEQNLNKDKLHNDKYFDTIENIFSRVFPSKNLKADFHTTTIRYEYTLFSDEENDMLDNSLFSSVEPPLLAQFDLSAEWEKDFNKFKWSSNYITKNLEKWQKFFDAPKTPDLLDKVKNSIYSSIMSDFNSTFPLASIFVPASRAIAAITDRVSSQDIFFNRFMQLKNFVLSFDNISNETVNKLLRIKNITKDKDGQPIFELLDERIITSLELSSGQQELLYLLLIINDLKETGFGYGVSVSVFIEEPCAHLFPKEQKETIEFLVHYFNQLQSKEYYGHDYRFFISSHSPYVLDTINNILEKYRLTEKVKKIKKRELRNGMIEKIKDCSFPELAIKDVSAYMIDDDGQVKPMMSSGEDGLYIYSEVIDSIANKISADSKKLFNIEEDIDEHLS